MPILGFAKKKKKDKRYEGYGGCTLSLSVYL